MSLMDGLFGGGATVGGQRGAIVDDPVSFGKPGPGVPNLPNQNSSEADTAEAKIRSQDVHAELLQRAAAAMEAAADSMSTFPSQRTYYFDALNTANGNSPAVHTVTLKGVMIRSIWVAYGTPSSARTNVSVGVCFNSTGNGVPFASVTIKTAQVIACGEDVYVLSFTIPPGASQSEPIRIVVSDEVWTPAFQTIL